MDVNRIPPKNISLSDIGGASKCIAQVLETIVMPLTHPEVYIHTGVPTPRFAPGSDLTVCRLRR